MGTGVLRRYHAINHPQKQAAPVPVSEVDPKSVEATAKVLNEHKPEIKTQKPRVPKLEQEPK